MDNYVITIARQYGSGGRTVGEMLSKRPLFDGRNGIYSKELNSPRDKKFTSDENLFNYQAKIIRELAEKENCVIIGRCSNFILDVSEYHNVLRVFVHASWDFRVKEAMKKMSGSQKEVEKFMRRDDKRKMEFCHRYTGKEWTDPSYYDLYLDTSVLGYEGVYAEIEKKYNKMRNS